MRSLLPADAPYYGLESGERWSIVELARLGYYGSSKLLGVGG